MTKSKLIICLLVSILFLSYTICYATSDINMNLLNSTNNTNTNINTNSNTNSNTNTSNTLTEDEEDYEDEDEIYTPSANVSSTTYGDSDELKIGDIINICLIVVGVLLVLLSIAILIRLKN